MIKNNKLKARIVRGWPPERRRAQAARIKRLKIWTRSSGPKTVRGKAICARNAIKLGSFTRGMRDMRHALACVRRFMVRFSDGFGDAYDVDLAMLACPRPCSAFP